jgi:hypothetical protein
VAGGAGFDPDEPQDIATARRVGVRCQQPGRAPGWSRPTGKMSEIRVCSGGRLTTVQRVEQGQRAVF